MDHLTTPERYPDVEYHNMTWEAYSQPEDESEIAKMSRGVATSIAVLFIGYMILGLTGNFLTILALLRCPRVRNVTAAFIISLCVADFLFCVLVLPWEVSRFLAGRWIWGDGWICTLFPLLRYWNVAVSLLSIAMITINRYIMIAHFSVYKSVYRKGWIALMIAFCWVFAFVMLLPTLLNKWGRFGFDARLQTCSILDDNNKSPKQVLFGIGFCVPAIIIVICYSLIFFVIHKSEMRMRHHSTRGMNGAHPGPPLQSQVRGTGKMEREARRRRNEWRITKMVLIIFIAFLVTYLPITLVKNLDKKVNYPGLHVLGYVLIYISSCINPVIYVIMNRQYRQAYKTVLLCKRPRLPSLTSSHSELPKGSASRRFASSRCSSCMSQGSLGGSARATPPQHDLGRPRPLSLHDDLCLRQKQPFRVRLLGLETPDRRSVEMVSLDGSRTLESARHSRVLRGGGGTRCPACQARRGTQTTSVRTTQSSFRNTQRLSFLHSEFGGRKVSRDECQDLECNSKAFLDHLLKVEASSSAETPSSSRSHSPKESRRRAKEENGRDSSDGGDGETEIDAPRAPPPPATQEPAPRRPSREQTPAGEPADPAHPAKTHRRSTTSSHSTSDATSPSDASSGETRGLSSASPSPSSTESNLSDVGRTEVAMRPKDAHVSSDLLREVSRGIYDRHASWAPWVPDLYPPVHENADSKEDIVGDRAISEDRAKNEDRAIREDRTISEVKRPISDDRASSEDKTKVKQPISEAKQPISEDKQPISEDRASSEDKKISEAEVHAKRGVPENVHGGANELHDHLEAYDNLSYVE